MPIVSSGRAARLIAKGWKEKYDYLPDAFVVEGPKAGGHLGFKTEQITDDDFCLEKLVPEILTKSPKEIELMLEMLVRSYDPCISCSTHYLDVIFI